MGRSTKALFGAALVALALGQAEAAWITRTYGFTATDWFNVPPTPPITTLQGSVTVTFNTSDTSLTEQTTGITLNSLNVSLGSAVGFIYDPTGFLPGTGIESLFVGGVANGVGAAFGGTDDFAVLIENPNSNSPSLAVALVSTASPDEYWRSETGTVALIPAPATIALLGIGLAGLAAMRRRKSN